MQKFLIFLSVMLSFNAAAQDTSLRDYNYLYYSGLSRSYMNTNILINSTLPFSSITFSDGKYDTTTNYDGAIEMYAELDEAAWDSLAYDSLVGYLSNTEFIIALKHTKKSCLIY